MDNSLNRQGSDTQDSNPFSVRLQILDRLLNWLAGFILLTEEEQEEAGVYPGYPGRE